jgi:hypothetical protein
MGSLSAKNASEKFSCLGTFKENLPVCNVSTVNTFPVNIVVVNVFAVVVFVIIAVVVVIIIAVVGVVDEVWLQQIYDDILLRESR